MKKFLLLVLFPLTSFSQVDLAIDSLFVRQSIGGHVQEGLDYYKYTSYVVGSVRMSAELNNLQDSATNVFLHVEVQRNSIFETEFYSDSINMCPGCSDSIYINQDFNFPWNYGVYDFIFTLSSDSSETDFFNNVDTFSIEVTDNWMMPVRRDNGVVTDSISEVPALPGSPASFGNVFQFENGFQFHALEAHIVPDTNFIGQLIYGMVHKYDTVSGIWIYQDLTTDYQIWDQDISNNEGVIELYLGHCQYFNAGDIYLITMGHYGGPTPIQFEQAQKAAVNSVLSVSSAGIDTVANHKAMMIYPLMDCPGGIEPPESFDIIKFYPNPSTSQTTIEFETFEASNAKIVLIDMQGKEVFEKSLIHMNPGLQQEIIETESIAPGIYTVSVQLDNQIFTEQLIIQH